eukprot:scaffold48108_cov67-Phaeocystis_antarctica.AAC.2
MAASTFPSYTLGCIFRDCNSANKIKNYSTPLRSTLQQGTFDAFVYAGCPKTTCPVHRPVPAEPIAADYPQRRRCLRYFHAKRGEHAGTG